MSIRYAAMCLISAPTKLLFHGRALSLCFPAGFLYPRHYKTCMTRAWGFNQSVPFPLQEPIGVSPHTVATSFWPAAEAWLLQSCTVGRWVELLNLPQGERSTRTAQTLGEIISRADRAVKSPAAVKEEGRTRTAGLRACGSRWPPLTVLWKQTQVPALGRAGIKGVILWGITFFLVFWD